MTDELTVDLLRHGETPLSGTFCGHSDPAPLPETAAAIARLTALGAHWQAVVSSPLQRCRQPAEQLAQLCGHPPQLDERLRELNFGAWEGHSAAAIEAATPNALARFWQDPDRHAPPSGERLSALEDRIRQAWAEILQRRESHLLLVTHAGPIRCILRQVLALNWNQAQQLQISPASLTRLRLFRTQDPSQVQGIVEFLNLRLPA